MPRLTTSISWDELRDQLAPADRDSLARLVHDLDEAVCDLQWTQDRALRFIHDALCGMQDDTPGDSLDRACFLKAITDLFDRFSYTPTAHPVDCDGEA